MEEAACTCNSRAFTITKDSVTCLNCGNSITHKAGKYVVNHFNLQRANTEESTPELPVVPVEELLPEDADEKDLD